MTNEKIYHYFSLIYLLFIMENTLLNPLLSLIFLLSISSFVYIFSKKINFPYTVSLVIVGLLLVPIIQM